MLKCLETCQPIEMLHTLCLCTQINDYNHRCYNNFHNPLQFELFFHSALPKWLGTDFRKKKKLIGGDETYVPSVHEKVPVG